MGSRATRGMALGGVVVGHLGYTLPSAFIWHMRDLWEYHQSTRADGGDGFCTIFHFPLIWSSPIGLIDRSADIEMETARRCSDAWSHGTVCRNRRSCVSNCPKFKGCYVITFELMVESLCYKLVMCKLQHTNAVSEVVGGTTTVRDGSPAHSFMQDQSSSKI